MTKTTIYYYISSNGRNPVREFILNLQKQQQAKVRRILQTISEYGLLAITSHIKKLTGTPLWEIRILGNDNVRILYITRAENSILVLHGFVKKTQKTPEKDIMLALKRFRELTS